MFYSYPTKYVKILLTKQVIFVKTIPETTNSYLLFFIITFTIDSLLL